MVSRAGFTPDRGAMLATNSNHVPYPPISSTPAASNQPPPYAVNQRNGYPPVATTHGDYMDVPPRLHSPERRHTVATDTNRGAERDPAL